MIPNMNDSALPIITLSNQPSDHVTLCLDSVLERTWSRFLLNEQRKPRPVGRGTQGTQQ